MIKNNTESPPFQLAACAEMLWLDKPIEWRAARLSEQGFGVGLWNWPAHNIERLASVGANFTIMNGYLEGRLDDAEGADILVNSIRETAQIGKQLGVDRLNIHGTGLGDNGVPVVPRDVVTDAMWTKATETLHRICDLAEQEQVCITLENLNPLEHPGCPFHTTEDVLALVSGVNRPQLKMNLDLYHTQLGDGDLVRWCEKCLPWIGEIQIADNPGRCEPGTGEINYRHIARALHNMGYRGPIGLEAFAKDDSDTALQTFRDTFTV